MKRVFLIDSMMTCMFTLLLAAPGCAPRGSGGGSGGDDDDVCDPLNPSCGDSEVCVLFVDGETRCSEGVSILGKVVQLTDNTPIEGAIVQAADINGAAVGTSAVTDADGAYELTVPAVRSEDGAPIEGIYTLRVQAHGYQEFPTALRPALPLDANSAAHGDAGWTIENTLTTVALISLEGDPALLGTISGIIQAESPAGILVVAETSGTVVFGFSDAEGNFTIFNVPAGSYSVAGYAAGIQLVHSSATVGVGETVDGIELIESDAPLSTVSGSVQIVNAPGGSVTSVVLALESTFQEMTSRGQVPPGLRVGNVTGAFVIPDVPDGRYVVLAAFENDDLVRDPDENISGTQIVHIEVPDPESANIIAITEGFKVTEALAVISPGADGPEQVDSLTPTLTWADDSSEDGYVLRVFDELGTLLWETEVESASGTFTVSEAYSGPALEPAVFYQFRVTSFREPGGGERSAISTTEDLKGVFYFLSE